MSWFKTKTTSERIEENLYFSENFAYVEKNSNIEILQLLEYMKKKKYRLLASNMTGNNYGTYGGYIFIKEELEGELEDAILGEQEQ